MCNQEKHSSTSCSTAVLPWFLSRYDPLAPNVFRVFLSGWCYCSCLQRQRGLMTMRHNHTSSFHLVICSCVQPIKQPYILAKKEETSPQQVSSEERESMVQMNSELRVLCFFQLNIEEKTLFFRVLTTGLSG